MAFPVVQTPSSGSEDASNVTSHTLTYPASIGAGDLLIAYFAQDGGSAVTWPNEGTEWIQLIDDNTEGTVGLSIAWKKAVGTESGTFEITTAVGERSRFVMHRITGAADPTVTPPQIATPATGTSATPDPPASPTPGAGAVDYVFIAAFGSDRDDTVDSYPSNMTVNSVQTGVGGGGANSCTIGVATHDLNTASAFNPNTFGISSSDGWVSTTLIVHPFTQPAEFDQDTYRGYADGTESGATALAAANTTWAQQLDEIFAVRYLIQQTATAAATGLTLTVKPQFRVDTGGGFGSWADVTGSSALQFANSTNLTDGGATTERLAGAGTFIAGEIGESGTQTMTFSNPSTSEDTEFLFVLQADSGQLNREDVVEVKTVLSGGSDLNTITNTASFTIEGPIAAGSPDTLNFTGLAGATGNYGWEETSAGNDTLNFTGQLGTISVGIGITETSAGPDTLNFTGLAGATGNYGLIETSAGNDTLNFTGLQGVTAVTVKSFVSGNMIFSGNIKLTS